MKNIIRNYFNMFVYVFFALFILAIRLSDKVYSTFYSISLIILAIYIIGATLLLNDCKIKNVRLGYFLNMFSLSLYLILNGIRYIFIETLFDNTFFNYFCLFVLALSIVGIIISIIYSFNNFFKKEYSIQQFDFYNFKLVLNELAFFAIIHVLINYSVDFGSLVSSLDKVERIYLVSSPIVTTICIVSIIYIPLYLIIEFFANKNKQPKI